MRQCPGYCHPELLLAIIYNKTFKDLLYGPDKHNTMYN